MTEIFNRNSRKKMRQRLRNNLTEAEKIIRDRIKDRKIDGIKFRRQVSIGPYIADFYCSKLRLVIEIDGDYHESEEAMEYDNRRNRYMESLGLFVIRYKNKDIYEDVDWVCWEIGDICEWLKLRRG